MDWTDEAIVLGRRKHGESSAIVALLTQGHGRHLGLVRGGSGSRAGGLYQPGNLVAARWRARLSEHLGNYACELQEGVAARLLDDGTRLGALTSACAVLEVCLPEREPHPTLYAATRALWTALDGPDWAATYVRWEMTCLADLGFGLDLQTCAVNGGREGLRYVSPRSGRAVSADAGAPFADRLLSLPAFLRGEGGAANAKEILAGLRLTGHFLERHVLAPQNRHLPPARTRLIDRLTKNATISSRS
jgi:DNA repair protein RecO (recombination protein O)